MVNNGVRSKAGRAAEAEEVDVLVAGGGSAGVAAACSAAEEGARTVLVEASGSVGGTLAWQYLEHSAGFHSVTGTQVVAGWAQRLVDRLAANGASPGHIRDDVGYTASRTPVDHAELALTESMMLAEVGASVWTESAVTAVTRGADGRLAEAAVHTPDGPRTVRAATVIDATGDAAVAALAGAPMQSDTAATQPVSLSFKLGSVEVPELLAYLRERPEELRPGSVVGEDTAAHANIWGLRTLLAEGHRDGLLSLRRAELHLAAWARHREVVVNVTRTAVGDGTSPAWRGTAHAHLSRQVLEFVRWFRERVPGFADCHLTAVADRVGVRESRRVLGTYTIRGDDVRGGAVFADAIGCGAFPIDVHAADTPTLSHTDSVGAGYEIPLGALLVPDVPNLLVAGRCLSSDHEANGSLRITATCFVTGEAAGVAAAQAAAQAVDPGELDVRYVRDRLAERGARIRLPRGNAAGEAGRGVPPVHQG
ncbi:FAD-dependent oxidoreductase [Streptomyces malaysiensis subsp. malaysiensis]|uniref:FAD-dependent oxidoreductase n=1 Tax=Streptomyces TaxID=1883 RepID=UPI001E5885CA|nr:MULTISPECIES: FAD-dependent oxidoreductase [unclassified Streptomyces]MCD9586420.1 FAD-dependent oxidoreductase [Streptomyces sp. 8ZJF_21]WHX23455.1 FAD-dependent oxidoreductase [Streptomyces sp. NA07423]